MVPDVTFTLHAESPENGGMYMVTNVGVVERTVNGFVDVQTSHALTF